MFFKCRFFTFFGNLRNTQNLQQKHPFRSFWGAFWEPSGHLWETFGEEGAPKAPKSGPKAIQRLQGSRKGLRKDEMPRLSRQVLRFFDNFLIL